MFEPADVQPAALAGRTLRSVADLTELIDTLAALDGGAGLTDADRITQLDALERVKGACAAAQARVTVRFVESQAQVAQEWRARAELCSRAGDFEGWRTARERARHAEFEPPSPSRGGRVRRARAAARPAGVAAQVGLARRESPARAARLVSASVALVEHLPHTLAALAAGLLSERRAELVVRLTSHLAPELQAAVDREVVGAAGEGPLTWGDRELERRVRAGADRLDAQAAMERARRAESERRVTIRPVPDTMAVVGAVLPVAQAVALHASLTAAAAEAKAAGDPRTKGQVMADTLVERVTGQATAAVVPVEVQVVITDRALLAGDSTPAHVPGYGSVPAGWARALLTHDLTDSPAPVEPHTADAGASDDHALPAAPIAPASAGRALDRRERGGPGTARGRRAGPLPEDHDDPPAGTAPTGPQQVRVWLRRLFTHPGTGTLVAMDSRRRLFDAGLRRFLVARDGTCRTPWCDAPIRHADHVLPHAAGGPTSDVNGQGLCVRCNLVKEQPGWMADVVDPGPTAGSGQPHTVAITTPTGHRHTSTAPPLLPGLAPRRESRSPLESWLDLRLAG
jgi:hypothetical protein